MVATKQCLTSWTLTHSAGEEQGEESGEGLGSRNSQNYAGVAACLYLEGIGGLDWGYELGGFCLRAIPDLQSREALVIRFCRAFVTGLSCASNQRIMYEYKCTIVVFNKTHHIFWFLVCTSIAVLAHRICKMTSEVEKETLEEVDPASTDNNKDDKSSPSSIGFIFACHKCDRCGKTPLIGTCFHSKIKENWDVCQECYNNDSGGEEVWDAMTELYQGIYTPELQKLWKKEYKLYGKMLVPYLNYSYWQGNVNGGNPPTPQQEWEFANLLYKQAFLMAKEEDEEEILDAEHVNTDDETKSYLPVEIPDMPESNNANGDDMVSWTGIQLDWFLNTFCASPFMQRLQDLQCDCAFVRRVAIPVIMKQIKTMHHQCDNNDEDTLKLFEGPAVASLNGICASWGIDMPSTDDADAGENNLIVLKDKATTVISYSGLYDFGFFVDALRAMGNPNSTYVWVDFMAINQFLWSGSKNDDTLISTRQAFVKQFQNQISATIGHTTVVLQSWENLLVPLNQLWIIFEAFMATMKEERDDVESDKASGMDLLMSSYFKQDFIQRVLEGQDREVHTVNNQLRSINSAAAVCGDGIDKEILLGQLQDHSSYDDVDNAVSERIRSWLIDQGRARISELQEKGATEEDGADTQTKLLMVQRNVGMMLSHLGRLDDALPILEDAFKKQQDILGKNHLQTLMTLYSLGLVYYKLERYEDAEPYLRESFERHEQIKGKHDIDTIAAAVNLAQNLHEQDRSREAEIFFRKVLAARTQLLGENNPLTLKSMHDLATVVWGNVQDKDVIDLGDNEAQVLFEKAVSGRKKILGEDHPQTLDSMDDLATVLTETLQHKESLILYQEIVKGYRLRYGDTHSLTLSAICSLARTYQCLKQFDAAIELFLEEIEGQRKRGEEEEALESMLKLASLYREQKRYDESIDLYKETVRGMEKIYGDTDPETIDAICELAKVHQEKDLPDFKEINALYQKAIIHLWVAGRIGGRCGGHPTSHKVFLGYAEALTKQYDMGERTAELLRDMKQHADMLVKRGDNRSIVVAAGGLLRKIHEAYKTDLGEEHETTLSALFSLAVFYERINITDRDNAEAERLHTECMELRRTTLGDGHSDTMESIQSVLKFLRRRSKLDEAEALCRAVVEAKEEPDKEKLRFLCMLGTTLFHQDKMEQAEPVIRQTLAEQESLLGKRNQETLHTMDVLVGVLRKRQKLDEAETVIREVIELRVQEQGEEHDHTVDSINGLIAILQDQGKLKMTDFVEHRRDILMGNKTKEETQKERWEENKKAIDWSLKVIALDPRNKQLAKKAWKKFGGDVLEPLLRSGAIALLDGSWLVDYVYANENPILSHRQALPPEAFIPVEDLVDASSSRGVHIALLSYMWLHPRHPDPKGETLKKVASWCQKSIESNLKLFLQFQNIPGQDLDSRKYSPKLALFWDFASLHQHPDISKGKFRTEKENELFEEGLAGLSTIFSHPSVEHVKCTKFPKGYPCGYDLPGGANVAEYSDRGWPLLESSLMGVSMIREKSNATAEMEVGQATSQHDITLETQQKTTNAPISPDAFQKRLQEVSFTNKKDDLPIVMNLYRTAFLPRFANVLDFDWSDANFNDKEVRRLAEIIELGYTPRLKTITVCGEELTAKGCAALGKAILAQPSIYLKSLGLDHFPTSPNQHNPNIGDDAVAALAKAMTQIETVTLENTSVGSAGCEALAKAFLAQIADGGTVRLKTLHLRGCKSIGDEAVQALSSTGVIFSHVHTLCLRECQIGDDGCEALAEGVVSLPEDAAIPLKSLDLAMNRGISAVGILQLVRLVARCPLLETLYLGPDLETDDVRKLLESVAQHPDFEVDFHSFGHHAGALGKMYKDFGVDSADKARSIIDLLAKLEEIAT